MNIVIEKLDDILYFIENPDYWGSTGGMIHYVDKDRFITNENVYSLGTNNEFGLFSIR